MARRYWLMKSDPETFGWKDLEKSKKKTTRWDGVRNYQARNFLRDEVQVGDGVLFYHSQSNPTAIVGTAKVVRAGYPDPTQFDPGSKGHDPDSDPEAPRWFAVDIQMDEEFERPWTLEEMKKTRGLENMILFKRGRLSVQPVTAEEWKIIVKR